MIRIFVPFILYCEIFYFEKVQAANDSYEMVGIDERLDIPKDDLNDNG